MASITLGTEGDPSSVYELLKIIGIKGCDGNLLYEIHNQANIDKKEPHPEFIKRSATFYDTFINSGYVDQWASDDISYAVKVDDVWFFAINTGSNTYLGSGPTSTLKLREFCFQNKIKILYIENSFQNWIDQTFKYFSVTVNDDCIIPYRNETQSYNEVNLIIKRCGDGITRIIDTADKLLENNYRDFFLATFHTHINFMTEGEAINRKGRTDLKITDRELGLSFIYEFKLHKNKSDIKRGLEQITKQYPTPINRFNGLILINQKSTNLATLLNEIRDLIKSCTLNLTDIFVDENNHKIVVKHKHHRDSNINCLLTIFIFDIQQ